MALVVVILASGFIESQTVRQQMSTNVPFRTEPMELARFYTITIVQKFYSAGETINVSSDAVLHALELLNDIKGKRATCAKKYRQQFFRQWALFM